VIRSEFKNVLVVVAHPDDAELGAGGSIARWVEDGAVVRTVVCTNGDKGTKDGLSPLALAHAACRSASVSGANSSSSAQKRTPHSN